MAPLCFSVLGGNKTEGKSYSVYPQFTVQNTGSMIYPPLMLLLTYILQFQNPITVLGGNKTEGKSYSVYPPFTVQTWGYDLPSYYVTVNYPAGG